MRREELKGNTYYITGTNLFYMENDYSFNETPTPYLFLNRDVLIVELNYVNNYQRYKYYKSDNNNSCVNDSFINDEYHIANEEDTLVLKKCIELGRILSYEEYVSLIITINTLSKTLSCLDEISEMIKKIKI